MPRPRETRETRRAHKTRSPAGRFTLMPDRRNEPARSKITQIKTTNNLVPITRLHRA
jgi:hypothetical protein